MAIAFTSSCSAKVAELSAQCRAVPSDRMTADETRRASMKRLSFKWLAAGLVLSAIGVGATAFNNGSGQATAGTPINWKTTAVSNTTNADASSDVTSQNYAKSLSGAFRSASEKVLPAVVSHSINSHRVTVQRQRSGRKYSGRTSQQPDVQEVLRGYAGKEFRRSSGTRTSGNGFGRDH